MAVMLIIAGIAGLVWSTLFALRGSLVAGCLAFLLAGCCFGHPLVHFDLGSFPLTIDRLVLLLMVVAFVVQRRLGLLEPKPWTRADALLAAFLAILLVSTFAGDWRVSMPGQVSPLWRLGGGYVFPAILYWMARQSPLRARHVGLVQGALACFGVYLAITAILEIAGQWSWVFPGYISNPNLGLHFGRARGPMIHAVSFGEYLAVCLLGAWLWRSRLGRRGQLAIVALVPLFLTGIYLTYTRSVWLGAALGLLIVLAMTLRGRWRTLVVGGAVVAGVMLALANSERLVGFRREGSAEETKQSVDMRGAFAYVSWMMFQDRPLLGAGFGQFPEAKLPYLADRSTQLHLESIRDYVHHNTFLSLLTETGLAGLGLFLALLVAWGRNAWALWRSPLSPQWARAQGVLMLGTLGVYVCQGMFHELSYTPLDNSLIFFLAGITAGLRPLAGTAPAAATAPAPSHAVLQPGCLGASGC
ncbi:MAG: O-antigen ligase family protein [Pirellulales bacterium]